MGKTLIAYYSRKGENYYGGSIIDLKKGNTEVAAEMIQKVIGGELFEIDTTNPYSKDYHTCTEEAMAELKANARPELNSYPESLSEYDTIFIGYPNWWGTCPMVVFTFLEHFDLTDKIIIPFCTNEGSGMGSSEADLKKICKAATVKPGLAVRGSDVKKSEDKIAAWAKKMI